MNFPKLKKSTQHRSLDERESKRFRLLQFARGALLALILFFLNYLEILPLESSLLSGAGICGIFVCGALLKKGWSFLAIASAHLATYAAGALLFIIAQQAAVFFAKSQSWDFYFSLLGDQTSLLAYGYLIAALSTFCYWRFRSYLSLEFLLAALGFVYVLSGHRNYRLDAPRQLSELTWQVELFQELGIEAQHLLIIVSFCFAALLFGYLALSVGRPIFGEASSLVERGKRRWGSILVLSGLFAALFASYGISLNREYSKDIGRSSNGVGTGENLGEGDSNLGFSSAVTSTKQPSAIVRLENDYIDNPDSPMLYLREGALSKFNGRELTKANAQFDRDIPPVGASEPYSTTFKPDDAAQVELTQSVYLLREHSASFAVGAISKVRPLKNPKTERFKSAYQAVSFAPSISVQDLLASETGDPSWDKQTWNHYLAAPGASAEHPGGDLRYAELSAALTHSFGGNIPKALGIIDHLSENSIYTRNPGHEVEGNGDPVAPYLFAEKKRGYCVHFAHAASYLFRLAGIPSRIGTGYQTDTRYAKDGHILLMMGDRHAWPEIYIRGRGWTVIDISPAEAENEPELVPDSNLLEELMSELDPTEEFLETLPEEASREKESGSILARLLNSPLISFLALIAAPLLLAVKLLYLNAFRLVKEPKRKMQLAYRSILLRLRDQRVQRKQAETAIELGQRLAAHSQNPEKIRSSFARFDQEKFGKSAKALSNEEVDSLTSLILPEANSSARKILRLLRSLNPFSIFKLGDL